MLIIMEAPVVCYVDECIAAWEDAVEVLTGFLYQS